ncbi:hypothetical protein VB779_23050 [Haloarculaceae archaeon H-GB11]|nr:hypothetical protein [Haloarculaceae archaeon H-GB11]
MHDTGSHAEQSTPRRIGFICNDDHSVFGDVADRLERSGIEVAFFEPGRRLDSDDLEPLTGLLNKKVDPESFRALRLADGLDVPTWNGYRTQLLGFRLVGYRALEHVGCRVPRVVLQRPEWDYVAKTYADWHFQPDPERNGEGDIYQQFVPTTGIDYKYYAVATGSGIDVTVLRTTSKLQGEKEPLDFAAPDPDIAESVRRLVRRTDSQALGVDFVQSEETGSYWAVDVNPAMSFRNAEMVPELVESVWNVLPGASVAEACNAPT